MNPTDKQQHVLSIVVPCYNEENTLADCISRVLELEDDKLKLEIIIVNDASSDDSLNIAKGLAETYSQIVVLNQEKNQGKGAALREGFKKATGDFVAIQDADLEYDPMELRQLVQPLIDDEAEVVFGSRYLSGKMHRVLYFWHTVGNKLLTLLSNMFTDLNLTDMETCYKVFKREVIQSVDIKENRFGFEPEIVAKIAEMKVRVYEIGISYYGRTYEEGKKIGLKDAFRALYCIFRYSAHRAPLPIQFLIYTIIGGTAAVFNLILFSLLMKVPGIGVNAPAIIAYCSAALLNYILCIFLLFKHKARWNSFMEFLIYMLVVVVGGGVDLLSLHAFLKFGFSNTASKATASVILLIVNFWLRKVAVFPEQKK